MRIEYERREKMNWISRLERRFGRFAIPNLMYVIIILYAVGFLLNILNPYFYIQYLSLNVSEILHGQIWRIVTFLIQPPSDNAIFLLIALYFYYMIGNALEQTWGSFRFNLYFFTGVLFHVIAAFLIYLFTGQVYLLGTTYLNLSLFFAFAAVYPDMEFLLFYLIPVKAKWLAWFDGVFFVLTVVQAFLPSYGGTYSSYRASAFAAVVSLLNFLIFYFSTRNYAKISPKQQKRRREFKKQMQRREPNHYSAQPDGRVPRHRCAVCGRTELDHPELEFRYCSKCNGNYEYCQDHLFTHEHVK